MNVYQKLEELGILPVIHISKAEWAEPLAQALTAGGIDALEVVFRSENAAEILSTLKKNHPEMMIGAGTILTIPQAEQALEVGADFIVSPGYDQKLVEFCLEKDAVILPGCTTASESQAAYTSGLRVVKFFPAEISGGVSAIEAFAGPFAGMRFLPTGGITLQNLGSYLRSSKMIACGGSFMAPRALLEQGSFTAITELCRCAVQSSLSFELAHVGINHANEEEAEYSAKKIAALFALPLVEHTSSVFAGTAVECMKLPFYGEKGHIGFRTSSMTRAMAWLRSMGIKLLEESKKYDAKGNVICNYLKEEIAGFAIHIVA